jgi:uncharacterized membrane protein YecN with MAPEG domain
MAPITAAHAALLVSMLTALAINTTRLRMRGGREPDAKAKEAILRASRAHGNTFEHVVPMLLLLLFIELSGGSPAWLWGLGSTFFALRVSYAYGMITRPLSTPMKVGAGGTYVVEIVAINYLIARLLCG